MNFYILLSSSSSKTRQLLERCRAIIKTCRAVFSSNRNSSSSPPLNAEKNSKNRKFGKVEKEIKTENWKLKWKNKLLLLFHQLWPTIWAGRNLVKMDLLDHHCLTEFEINTHQTLIIIIGFFYLKRPVSIVTPTSQKFEGWIWRVYSISPFFLESKNLSELAATKCITNRHKNKHTM